MFLAVDSEQTRQLVLSAVVLLLSFLLLLFSAPVGLLLLGGPLVEGPKVVLFVIIFDD